MNGKQHPLTKVKLKRIAFASALGTSIEFYDFTLFGVFTPILSKVFFPGDELKLTLIIFASGFIMRPFGAIIFGYIGDRIGRKPALTLTILLMSIPTFVIGILPSYHSIGIAAPILLILCRLIQGIFAGGEHNGAAVYVAEHWPKNHSGMASSIIISGVFLGVFSAVVSGILATSVFPSSFAWRIPFIMGIVIGLVGLYIRLQLTETPAFDKISILKIKNKLPASIIFSENFYSLFSTFIIGGFAGVIGYTIAVYVNMHLHSYLGISFEKSIFLSAICMFSAFVSSLIVGKVSDKYGHIYIMLLANIILVFSAYPIYMCLNSNIISIIVLANVILGILTGIYCSPIHAVINQMFPVRVRYTGTSLGYSLGMSIFGGTTPLVSTLLIDTFCSYTAPAIYIIVTAFISCLVLFSWKKRMDKVDDMPEKYIYTSFDVIKPNRRSNGIATHL